MLNDNNVASSLRGQKVSLDSSIRGVRNPANENPLEGVFQVVINAPSEPRLNPNPLIVKWQMVEVLRPRWWQLGQEVETIFGNICEKRIPIHKLGAEFVPQFPSTINPNQDVKVVIYNPARTSVHSIPALESAATSCTPAQDNGCARISTMSTDTVPRGVSSIVSGEEYIARIKLKNTGTTVWNNNYKLHYQFGEQGSNNRITGEIAVPRNVDPDKFVTLEYKGVTLKESGSWPMDLQMKVGDREFAAMGHSAGLEARRNNLECGTSAVSLTPTEGGSKLKINVNSIKNTGNTLWKSGSFKFVGTSSNNVFGNIEFDMPQTTVSGLQAKGIVPGATLAQPLSLQFIVNMNELNPKPRPQTAPYTLSFKMKEGNTEFGPACTKDIKVEPYFDISGR